MVEKGWHRRWNMEIGREEASILLRACFKSPYSAAISKFWLQNIQISSCYLPGSTPQSLCFSLKILKFRDERDF